MKLKDTKINIGGLMRCCLSTISEINPEMELTDGMVFDCKYEKQGNMNIILEGNIFRWRSSYANS